MLEYTIKNKWNTSTTDLYCCYFIRQKCKYPKNTVS